MAFSTKKPRASFGETGILEGKIMKKYLTIITALTVFALTITPCSAKKDKGVSDYLVRISHNKSKTTQTAFIADYLGKPVVICDSKAFGNETVIKDSNGETIEYSEIWVPTKEEKRKVLIIVLPENESNRPKLQISAKFAKGDPVSAQGYSASTGKLYTGSGKIIDVTKEKISISGKVRQDINGAPVFTKSKQVIGVGKCIKNKKMEMPYAERIDNIANFAKLSAEQVKKEEEYLATLESSVVEYAKTYMELKKTIEESGYNKESSFKHLEPKELKEIKEEIKELSEKLKEVKQELTAKLKDGKKREEPDIPVFRSAFRSNLARAEEILERKIKPVEELLEKVAEELNKTF